MPVLTIPFDSGINEGVDPRLLPAAKLRRVVNARLSRDGQLRPRPNYTALANTTYAGNGGGGPRTMTAYDVVSYEDRLVAFGNALSAFNYPTDLFELVDIQGAAKQWRAVSAPSSVQALPRATGVRDMGSPPDQNGAVQTWQCAASAGFVSLIWSIPDAASTNFLHIFNPDTDSTVFIGNPPVFSYSRIAALSDRVIVMGSQNGAASDAQMAGGYYRYASDTAITTVSNLYNEGSNSLLAIWDLCKVHGSDEIVTAVKLANNTVVVRRFNSSLVKQTPSGGDYATITSENCKWVSVVADAVADTITVAVLATSDGALRCYMFVLSTGATIGSPPLVDTSFSTIAGRRVALVRFNGASTDIMVNSSSAILHSSISSSGAVQSGLNTVMTFGNMGSSPIRETDGGPLIFHLEYAAIVGALALPGYVSGLMVSWSTTAAEDVAPLFSKDEEIVISHSGFSWPNIVQDSSTGKYYWANATLNTDAEGLPLVTEFELGSAARRQCVQIGHLMLIGGGLISSFDGRLYRENGFLMRPFITNLVASNGAGSLTNSGVYNYRAIFEWVDADRNVCRSPVAFTSSVTLGASDDTVAVSATVPVSMRMLPAFSGIGTAVRVKFFRTVFDATDGPGSVFQLVGSVSVKPGASLATLTDTLSDASLRSQEVLYTDVESPLEHHAPTPGDYLAVGNGRIVVAGQPHRANWTVSKPIQPAQTVEFAAAGTLAFEGRINAEIEAVITRGETIVLFTRREVWMISGQGPDIRGIGEYFPEQRLLASKGMRRGGWQSIIQTDEGDFFQLDDSKIYVLQGGTATWIGHDVQNILDEFPVVVAACHISRQQAVAFAVQTEDGTDGTLLLYDLRRKIWLEDDVGAVSGLAEYDGRLAYVQSGVVYLEDESAGIGTFVPITVKTGAVPMATPAGTGAVDRVVMLGPYQGDCTVTLRTSYDDGRTYPDVQSENVLASSGYSVDDPVELEFVPPRGEATRVHFQVDITYSGTNSQGIWLNALDVHYQQDDGPSRLGDARRR